jgi:hypothetical protein
LFEEDGFLIQEWDKVRTDQLTIREGTAIGASPLKVAPPA